MIYACILRIFVDMINYYDRGINDGNANCGFFIKYDNVTYKLRISHFSKSVSRGNKRPHSHAFYHVIYYISQGELLIGDSIRIMDGGDIALISPDQPHYYAAVDNKEYSYYEITFEFISSFGKPLRVSFYELFSILFPSKEVNELSPVFNVAPVSLREEMALLFKNMPMSLETIGSKGGEILFGVALESLLVKLLFMIVDMATGIENPEKKKQGVVGNIRAYIHSNYQRCFRLRDIAKACGGNEQHLNRVFKKASGYNIMDYTNRLRIDTARRIMDSEGYSVKETAYMMGFKDEFYFSRVFKRYAGISPDAFRKSFCNHNLTLNSNNLERSAAAGIKCPPD